MFEILCWLESRSAERHFTAENAEESKRVLLFLRDLCDLCGEKPVVGASSISRSIKSAKNNGKSI